MESVFEFIFSNAAEGILVVNSESELIHLNPAAAAMLEVTPESTIGTPIGQTFNSTPQLLRLLSIGGPRQLDIKLPHERLAQGIASDTESGRTVLLHDVTERREFESRREVLVKKIAHDLRNPLNALNGYANLVEKSGELNELQSKFLTRIQQTTIKMYEMASKLVDLAWIEAGMPLTHVPVELTGITREVMRELSYIAHKQHMSIVNSIPDELPYVIGDPQRLKQTIQYLLDNAIRYSLDGGNVVVHAWHQGDEVYYTVADQGIGIRADELDKIWDRMWRSNDERVRDIPGGGIGLCFARTIITRHGGAIWAESEAGQGSTFTFRLPLSRGE